MQEIFFLIEHIFASLLCYFLDKALFLCAHAHMLESRSIWLVSCNARRSNGKIRRKCRLVQSNFLNNWCTKISWLENLSNQWKYNGFQLQHSCQIFAKSSIICKTINQTLVMCEISSLFASLELCSKLRCVGVFSLKLVSHGT